MGRIREGMTVFSADGQKLGKVIRCGAGEIIIEKGFFFPKDYVVREADVASITDDDVRLLVNRDALMPMDGDRANLDTAGAAGVAASGAYGASTTAPYGTPAIGTRGATEDVSVPVIEERLEAEKRVRAAGEVRVEKNVVVEEKHITVPVVREEVRVERVPVDRPATTADAAAFKNDTIRVPVTEEEIEIRKRPVVREEVRISKTPHVEQRTASESVRREEVEVHRDDETRRTGLRGDGIIDDDDDTRR